jgi:transcriptional regulator with XRE-family HTH domain
MSELGELLRAWRDRVSPVEVGMPSGGDRRSPGLRREELASLAGLSVDYIMRLEQGRATHPSVLGSLARALRLTDEERDHLYRVAGAAPVPRSAVPRHITPGIQRIVDHFAETPISVFSAAWDALLVNPMWSALFGDMSPVSGRSANIVWRQFMEPSAFVLHEVDHSEAFRNDLVADLHAASGRYPTDAGLQSLIADLRAESPEFAALWGTASISAHLESRKTVLNPTVGPISLFCDVLAAPGSDMRIVVYTATPGSSDAAKLDLLRVAGTQVFDSPHPVDIQNRA